MSTEIIRADMTDPADWVMVPRVATKAMVTAGRAEIPAAHGQGWVYFPEAWAAAIAAAPQPPKPDREAVARIIDSGALEKMTDGSWLWDSDRGRHRRRVALAKADDIIAIMEANHG